MTIIWRCIDQPVKRVYRHAVLGGKRFERRAATREPIFCQPTKFNPQSRRVRHRFARPWRVLARWDQQGKLPSGLLEIVQVRVYWSNNQFLVNFRQFPASTDDVSRTKMTR